jgi:GNAT superfamily N-acetyltransferase
MRIGGHQRRFPRKSASYSFYPPQERRMSLEIVSLEGKYLEDAATLVAQRYQRLCVDIPYLPTAYGESATILPLLTRLADRAPGVVALRSGRVAGLLLSYLLPDLRGSKSTYSPEWANAAAPDEAGHIYQEMYRALSARWAADGYFEHLVTMLGHDREGMDAWHWLGFGYVVIDAVRELAPLTDALAETDIRRASSADLPAALPLWRGLWAHLASAPTFLVDALDADDAEFDAWLADPANALWLAYVNGEAVACLGIGPANHHACTIIRDARTASIVSAFTREDVRGAGVASALLERALAWARDEGYCRCAVDFEAMNVPAARFWLRHFTPVCYSFGRHVNARIALWHERAQPTTVR